jgi:hypothetical protein
MGISSRGPCFALGAAACAEEGVPEGARGAPDGELAPEAVDAEEGEASGDAELPRHSSTAPATTTRTRLAIATLESGREVMSGEAHRGAAPDARQVGRKRAGPGSRLR